MALIPEYIVVADMYPVGDSAITAGQAVTFSAGFIVPAPTATDPDVSVAGIAGDSALSSSEGQTTAYSSQVYIGANGDGTRYTENRVSDFYDETAASQKVTVYNGGGKFWISSDLFDSNAAAIVAGTLLKVSGTTIGSWAGSAENDDVVAMAMGASQAYESGVPGTDVNGSTTLGNFVPVVLRV